MKRRLTYTQIVWRVIGGISMMFAVTIGAFSGAYLLTRWFYSTHTVSWNDYVIQLVNWGVGLLLMVILAVTVNLLTIPKQRMVWTEMIDALRQIAKGNFNVVIDREGKYHGQIGDFVESINEMTQELKQMDQLRQEFISNVSHEIQSPLTSIRGFAHMLQREDLSREEQLHYLSIMEKETVRLSRLSDNLLKLTSLEAQDSALDKSRYRLDTQLENIVLSCEPQWLEKRLDIELDLQAAEIWADEQLLGQVWLNLIHNAIKFTPEDGCIRIASATGPDGVKVTVADSGIGIPEEDLQRIFERFYKGDKQRTRTIEGNGLGLSIVHKIVDLHEGEIQVSSRPREGTLFEVILPRE